MDASMRAFYEWFHENDKSGILLDHEREAFLAGWAAKEQYIHDTSDWSNQNV